MDNLEIIKELISLDEKAPQVLLEMITKNKNNEYGYMKIHYENGKINCIKSERCLK